MLSCGLTDNPVTSGYKEETTFLIGVHVTGDIVIFFTELVMDFSPVVVVVSAVFIYDFGFRLFCAAKLDNVNIFVNGKINEDFIIRLMNDTLCGIRRRKRVL